MHANRIAATGLLALLMTVAVACGKEPVPFELAMHPEMISPVIPGQELRLLLTATSGDSTISLSATATNASVDAPSAMVPGDVAEVVVTANELPVDAEGGTVTVTVAGERDGLTDSVYRELEVWPSGGDPPLEHAEEVKARFVAWLDANWPGLAVGEDVWEPVVTRPRILVVSYYLFFSERWEMGVRWHVTIAPHDWAELYLRERGKDVEPTRWFKLDSWTNQTEPYEIPPVEEVWR